MHSQKIIESLSRHITLSLEEQKCLINHLEFIHIKKKHYFLKENEIAKHVAFVLRGCLRSYSIDENGFEHVLQFAPVNWWITDMYSIISQKESQLYIEAIMDTDIYMLSRVNQLKLFDEIPKLERYFRILTENALVSSRQRLLDRMSLTAKERYQMFCKIYPTLRNEIPQKYIASFIGVTPEFLSKLRKDELKMKK